jgi:hypothetical protein
VIITVAVDLSDSPNGQLNPILPDISEHVPPLDELNDDEGGEGLIRLKVLLTRRVFSEWQDPGEAPEDHPPVVNEAIEWVAHHGGGTVTFENPDTRDTRMVRFRVFKDGREIRLRV